MTDTDMRVFAIEHEGEWLPGYSVYIGETEPTPEQIKEHLAEHFPYRKSEMKVFEVREMKPGMNMVWDGDY